MVFVFIGLFICFCGKFTAEVVLFALAVSAALFAFCIAGMVSSTFSSFLYAQF